MSFQDLNKSGAPRRTQRSHLTTTDWHRTIPETNVTSSGADSLAQLSDGILQYQRNVGILEKIAHQIGTPSDGAELQMQFDVQVDVLNQLGQRLETTLLKLETSDSVDQTEAAKHRASIVKLRRDFHRIESSYKNILSETERRRIQLGVNQQQGQKSFGHVQNEGAMQEDEQIHHLQMQQNLNEEIMRERENEIRNINRGMHQVNEIYKDLAHIVGSQQEQIDQIETQMEESKVNAQQGLSHIQKANEKAGASQCTIS